MAREQGVLTNELKLKIYPAVIAILGLSLVALMMSRIQIQVARESVESTNSVPTNDEIPPASPKAQPLPSPAPVESPIATPSPIPTVAAAPPSVDSVKAEGGLRVSNQTGYPIRLALLSQASKTASADAYSQPVHWDFAPQEGRAKGLILSLPNSNLRLQTGDVLVAFAQDGSRRYWGPFVVGKTQLPTWSAEQKEWLLILQP